MVNQLLPKNRKARIRERFSRQKRFAHTLTESHLEGFLVTHAANLRYLCGYTGSNGLLLFLGGRPVFFTDGRYTQQAREEVEGARVIIAKGPLVEAAGRLISAMKSATIGFEADLTTVAAANQFRKLAHKKITWKPTSGLIMRQRLIKDTGELKIIREAVNLGAAVYESAVHSHSTRHSRVRGCRTVGVCCAAGGGRRHVVRHHRCRWKALCLAAWSRNQSADSAPWIRGSRFRRCAARLLFGHDADGAH